MAQKSALERAANSWTDRKTAKIPRVSERFPGDAASRLWRAIWQVENFFLAQVIEERQSRLAIKDAASVVASSARHGEGKV